MRFEAKVEQGSSCVSCTNGKQNILSLSARSSKSSTVGQVIYTDVCSPIPVKSIRGSMYCVTFNDSFSRWKKIYLMKLKTEVANRFETFQKKFERRNDCKIKLLYSDNGGEYIVMQDDREKQGIEWEHSAPCTPQPNGVAERSNRTLIDSTITMLIHCGLPHSFWGETVVTASFLRSLQVPVSMMEERLL